MKSVLTSAVLLAGSITFAHAADPITLTDHATFDSTNPANIESGVYCQITGVANLNKTPRPWKMHVSVSNIGGAAQTIRIRDFGGGLVQYPIPANSSVGLTYAAGNNKSSGAFRVDADGATTLSGYVSAEVVSGAPENSAVFCTSCDQDDSGRGFCDGKIPN